MSYAVYSAWGGPCGPGESLDENETRCFWSGAGGGTGGGGGDARRWRGSSPVPASPASGRAGRRNRRSIPRRRTRGRYASVCRADAGRDWRCQWRRLRGFCHRRGWRCDRSRFPGFCLQRTSLCHLRTARRVARNISSSRTRRHSRLHRGGTDSRRLFCPTHPLRHWRF
ncbi:MAG: hypothetical protein PWP23_1943 [Candidatus Sumerlaeota bacterium]|nr:hypothetical protein [Candidatus Sumerlaeota bacterium]